MHAEDNKKYWNEFNSDYSKVWESKGRQEMSKKELAFLTFYLKKHTPKKILDVGIGNGRILENAVQFSSEDTKIYGVDISKEMVDICKKRFGNESKIFKLETCDFSQEDIPFVESFDFVTMIRVLKYNANWKEMIGKVYKKLNQGGIYIFTMPNNKSIARFSGDTFSEANIPIIHTSKQELKAVFEKNGFKLITIESFSKMPNFLYHLCQNKLYVKVLLALEKFLEILLGKSNLGRVLFVVVQK